MAAKRECSSQFLLLPHFFLALNQFTVCASVCTHFSRWRWPADLRNGMEVCFSFRQLTAL